MIYLFYGDQRQALDQEIQKTLGSDYEVTAGEKLTADLLPELFLGTSLFATRRKIVVRGFSDSGLKLDTLKPYLDTPHQVILTETKFSPSTAIAKELLKTKKFVVREFKLPPVNTRAVFDVFNTAKRDGQRAVQMLEQIIDTQEPQPFFGLMVSQAIKAYTQQPTPKNQRILRSLAELDMDLKTSAYSGEPWLLIKGWLLRLSSL